MSWTVARGLGVEFFFFPSTLGVKWVKWTGVALLERPHVFLDAEDLIFKK